MYTNQASRHRCRCCQIPIFGPRTLRFFQKINSLLICHKNWWTTISRSSKCFIKENVARIGLFVRNLKSFANCVTGPVEMPLPDVDFIRKGGIATYVDCWGSLNYRCRAFWTRVYWWGEEILHFWPSTRKFRFLILDQRNCTNGNVPAAVRFSLKIFEIAENIRNFESVCPCVFTILPQ